MRCTYSRLTPVPSPLSPSSGSASAILDAPLSTNVGMRVRSFVLSPVFEERHSLWQWRTVAWRDHLHAVPFLLHCAPGVQPRCPLLHRSAADALTGTRGRADLFVQTPIGKLPAAVPPADDVWSEELFRFLERAAERRGNGTYTSVFARGGEPLPPGDSTSAVPLSHRNAIGGGLAETVLAIDRYGAMLARRDLTMAKACWAVLCDSKADVQPYLRCSAVHIEMDLCAAAAAHAVLNAAVKDPMQRPLLALRDYPSVAGW